MKICLVFPPPAELTQPYLALPALTAYLRLHGFDDVEQHDLGLEAFETLAAGDNLSRASRQVARELERLDRLSRLTAEEVLHYDALSRAVSVSAGLSEEIETSKTAFRRPETFADMASYRHHSDRVQAAFRVLSAACYPTEWTEHHFTMARSRRLPGRLLLLRAADADHNPLFDFMRDKAGSLLQRNPALIGLSVAFGNQLIPALTLAGALRDAGYQGHAVLGGAFISHCYRKLRAVPELFELVDSFVAFAGRSLS